jgi:hypothetical protein
MSAVQAGELTNLIKVKVFVAQRLNENEFIAQRQVDHMY